MQITYMIELGIFPAFGLAAFMVMRQAAGRNSAALDELKSVRAERDGFQRYLQQVQSALAAVREDCARLDGQHQALIKSLEAKNQECGNLGSEIASPRTRLEAEVSASSPRVRVAQTAADVIG